MSLYSILGVSPKSLDCQIALDPFEERLNLPPIAADVSYFKRTKFQIIGNE